MEYNPQPNVKKAKSVVIILFLVAVFIFILPSFPFLHLPASIFQMISFVIITLAVLLLTRYVFTDFTYQIKDLEDNMSPYPKLNIYRITGKRRSHMAYCIPFNQIISVEKSESTRTKGEKSENLCPSLAPKEIYKVSFLCDDQKEAVYLECNDEFAKEVAARIRIWSDVLPEE